MFAAGLACSQLPLTRERRGASFTTSSTPNVARSAKDFQQGRLQALREPRSALSLGRGGYALKDLHNICIGPVRLAVISVGLVPSAVPEAAWQFP